MTEIWAAPLSLEFMVVEVAAVAGFLALCVVMLLAACFKERGVLGSLQRSRRGIFAQGTSIVQSTNKVKLYERVVCVCVCVSVYV